MSLLPLKRKLRAASWQLRQVRVIAKAMYSRYHPIVAHIIPVRRCNMHVPIAMNTITFRSRCRLKSCCAVSTGCTN